MSYRSLLFVPGHRESMLAKAELLEADAVVFDLEDSVPLDQRDTARSLVRGLLQRWNGRATPFVRFNSPHANVIERDTEVVAGVNAGIVIPKVDLPGELDAVFDALGSRDREVIITLETPRALLRAEGFADTFGVHGLFVGGEDLTHAMRSRRTPEGEELRWARNVALVAARAAGIFAYDTICPEFRDLEVLERDCRTAAGMGYDGKFAIHPAQLAVIHRVFAPSEADLEQAQRIVQAFDQATAAGHGAVALDGQMIDPPVAERARALLARATVA